MKIVVYVDYSNVNFNKDFMLSNRLIGDGHNVFLAINNNQFEELKKNCDKSILGFSYSGSDYNDLPNLNKISIEEIINN